VAKKSKDGKGGPTPPSSTVTITVSRGCAEEWYIAIAKGLGPPGGKKKKKKGGKGKKGKKYSGKPGKPTNKPSGKSKGKGSRTGRGSRGRG
jgi:hypothetical protein